MNNMSNMGAILSVASGFLLTAVFCMMFNIDLDKVPLICVIIMILGFSFLVAYLIDRFTNI